MLCLVRYNGLRAGKSFSPFAERAANRGGLHHCRLPCHAGEGRMTIFGVIM
jgi:hypothetical protein